MNELEGRPQMLKPLESFECPNCGVELSDYEIFACRIRGLKTPVCLGCLADALVFMKTWLLPTLETALTILEKKGLPG